MVNAMCSFCLLMLFLRLQRLQLENLVFCIDLNSLYWCLWLPAGLQYCYTQSKRNKKSPFVIAVYSVPGLFLLLGKIIYLFIYSLMSQLIFKEYFFGQCYIWESSSFQMSLNYNWLLKYQFQPVCISLALEKRPRISTVFVTLFLLFTLNRNQERKKVSEPSREEGFVPERGKSLENVKTLGFFLFQGYY